jgi:hypothetical protein
VSERSLSEALEQRDITLALTPTQLVLLALGAIILLRTIRALRRA